jgi:large subunit ribosomal protein L9
MFGAVTPGMIADQLKTQFDISLDKRKIHLEHPIRALGEQEVELRLHADVQARLKVRVESSTPPPVVEVPEAKKDDVRTEKRGRRGDIVAGKTEEGDRKARPARSEKAGGGDRPARAEKPQKS